jgi:hypothetical protein
MVETAREALVLVRGTVRIEDLYKRRRSMSKADFDAEREKIIRETAAEYGPTFYDDCGEDQLFDNAELTN